MDVIFYDGSFDIKFGKPNDFDENGGIIVEKSLYSDFGLIPMSRPVITIPEVKTNSIDIPGGSGKIILDTFLTGYSLYNNRNLQATLMFDGKPEEWAKNLHKIYGYLHGKKKTVQITGEEQFYRGYFYISEVNSEQKYTTITIQGDLEPLAYNRYCTATISSPNSAIITMEGENVQPVKPVIFASLNNSAQLITLQFINPELAIDWTFNLYNGYANTGGLLMLSNFSGENTCTFNCTGGSGTVTIGYLEGII